MDINYLRYPAGMSSPEVIERISDILFSCPGAFLFNSEVLAWPNYIKRLCSHYGVHPAWPIISMQREQSLLGNPSPSGLKRACGFVGQDNPGTANKTWDGLATQLFLCVRNMAWYMGDTPNALFGATEDQWPKGVHRWNYQDDIQGHAINLLDDPPERKIFADKATWCQLTYTPHISVLATNELLIKKWIVPHF